MTNPIKAAYYLVPQGPYREPRTIDLQFVRLRQYRALLENKLDRFIDLVGVYVDLDVDTDSLDLASYPELDRLISDIKSCQIDTVLVDIEIGRPFRPYQFMPLIRTIEQSGASLFNSFYDDHSAFQHAVATRWGKEVASYAYRDDIDDFISLFPGLAAKVGKALLTNYEARMTPAVFEELWVTFDRFGDQNPYQAGLPMFNDRDLSRIRDFQKKRMKERRETEELLQLGPDDEGKLLDDLTFGTTRSEQGMKWVIDRLKELGFQEIRRDRFISYRRQIEGHVVYADPRKKGRIDFYVYDFRAEVRGTSGRRKQSRSAFTKWSADFYILDSWKHDLSGKWYSRFRNVEKDS